MQRQKRGVKRTYRMKRTLPDGRQITISKPFLDMSVDDLIEATMPLLARRNALDLEIAILSNTVDYLSKHGLTHVSQIDKPPE